MKKNVILAYFGLISLIATSSIVIRAMETSIIISDAILAGKNSATIKKLIEENPSCLNQKDDAGCTPLLWAVSMENVDIVNYLLMNGAEPNVQDENGNTPLHYCCFTNDSCGFNSKSQLLLLEYGANPLLTNIEGLTPLQTAIETTPQEIITRYKIWQEKWRNLYAARFTICTGIHQRTGANSNLRTLQPNCIQQICGYLKPNNFPVNIEQKPQTDGFIRDIITNSRVIAATAAVATIGFGILRLLKR